MVMCNFRLGKWLVEPSLNKLSRNGKTVQLRPKLMDVLAYLASRPGGVVSREEILESVWSREFIAESALTRTIAELRKTLGDNAGAPRFIETISKRGYRLIARVERVSEPATARSEEPARSRSPSPSGNHTCRLCWGEQEIPLAEGESVIGRSAEAAVRISSSRVSRRHARIVVTGGRAVLEDLGSKNGTYLRGHMVRRPVELSDGDEICFGRDFVVFRFCYPAGTTLTDDAL
jgi:DNA-binding winged helix-turn-helix (wHTH) protein